MIPNIIRLQEQMKEVHASLEMVDTILATYIARHSELEARLELQHAHIENLIQRVYELEGSP